MLEQSMLEQRIAENVAAISERITQAAAKAGRQKSSIQLVAVSKYVGLPEIRALAAAGCRLMGESRPQQLSEKTKKLADLPIRWHLIGHLQRNKIRRTLPLVAMIESVDTPQLVASIDRIANELSLVIPLLLEVNISGESAKHGFEPNEMENHLHEFAKLKQIAVRGLMGMAAWGGSLDDARRDFASLRELRDRLRVNCPEGIALEELSMGMSGDFEVAIAEGATLLRIGSALFEGIS